MEMMRKPLEERTNFDGPRDTPFRAPIASPPVKLQLAKRPAGGSIDSQVTCSAQVTIQTTSFVSFQVRVRIMYIHTNRVLLGFKVAVHGGM